MRMADLKAYTSIYSFPYPLAGDSVQNTYSRIQELAERIEATYTLLGVNLDGSTKLMQEGDAAGGDLLGSTYPNPTIKADAITTAKILNSAVTTAKIADANVTTAKLATSAVTTDKLDAVALKDGSTAPTQARSDNSTKIATTAYVDRNVIDQIPNGAIDTNRLADGAVTNTKVNAAAAIAYSKLNLASSIVNADVATGAAIAYSKLNLTGSIVLADLAFDIATQAELDTHTNATTSVHGITNTANIVYTSDSRLSDTRTPTDGTVTNVKVAAGAAIAYSKLALTGSIVNADIGASAAISYSKLALSNSIVNADIVSLAWSKITGTPTTLSGYGITDAFRTTDTQTANTVLSGPTTGIAAAPTFRALVAADIPTLAASKITGIAVTQADTGTVTSTMIADGTILNADVNSAAGITYSKLSLLNSIVNADVSSTAAISYSKLSLANSIVNADISSTAAIAYSKLNLSGSIVNADISASAAIADSKLATISTAGKVANSATTATSSNTASTIVSRDASGNFSAGTITGSLSGNATTVTNGVYTTDTGTVTNTMLAGSIADSKLSTISTANKVSNSATTANSNNIGSSIVARDSYGNFSATTITANLTGNVSGTATPLSHAGTHVPGGSDVLDYTKIIGYGTSLPTWNATTHPAGVLWVVNTVGEPYSLYRSDGVSAWKQVGGGGASITVSDTAPSSPVAGAMWYDSTTGRTFIRYNDGSSSQWVEIGEASQLSVPTHGSSHVRGGNDVLDGDRVTIDYVPTRYTRNSAASGAGDNTDLTAHLSGIDNNFNNVRVDSSGRVTTPNQTFFNAYRTANVSQLESNPVAFNATYQNVGSTFNTSTYTFTAPVSGVYIFYIGLYGSSSFGQVWLNINGNRTDSHWYGSGGLTTGTCMYYLNANDTVSVTGYINGSTTYTLYGGNVWTFFRGYLLG